MDTQIVAYKLQRFIAEQGKSSMTTRQIAKRLKDLLPVRLKDLRREAERNGMKGSKADRIALADTRYEAFLDEYISIVGSAYEARVQFETHKMLANARRSLRRFRS